jgi:iron complex outermembrane receptor protein
VHSASTGNIHFINHRSAGDAKVTKATSGKIKTRATRVKSKTRGAGAYRVFDMTPLAAAVLVALCPFERVLAQEDEPVELGEITVTATKREVNLQDLPQAIDVLSGSDLQKMAARNLEDTIRALPSVSLNYTQPGRNSLVIRGISTGAFEYRTDSQVAVYLDEQPMTTNSQQVGVRNIDMARIEALAGPQGTLFGSNSQTGTLRYITNKPDQTGMYGNLEARYGFTDGGEGSHDISGFLNIPVIENTLALRLVGYTSKDGGFVDNVYGTSFQGGYDNAEFVEDDFNEYETDGGRLAALWLLNDDWSLLGSLVAENTSAVGSWDTDPFLGDHQITRFQEDFRDDDWYSAALTLKGDVGFADLSVTVTHFDRDIAYSWDNMAYSQFKDRTFGGGLYYEQYYAGNPYYYNYYNLPLYNSEYIPSSIYNDQEQQRDAIEIRFSSNGGTSLQWAAGAFYEDVYDEWYYGTVQAGVQDTAMWGYANYLAYYYGVASNYYNNYTPNQNISYPLAPTDVSYSNSLKRSVKQTAIFGEISYDLTDKLTILGGARWAEYDRNTYSRFSFPEGLPAGDRGTSDGSYSDIGKSDDTIFKASVSYKIDEDRMIYGLFSQGFRLGGLNSPRAAATGSVPQVYDPDYLDNYEFGIKSRWLNNRLTINADVFFMEWSEYQQGASFGIWWLRGTVNAEKAETKGFELQADWQATDRLLLSGNLFMADPEFSEDWSNNFVDGEQQPPNSNSLNVRKGMPMPGSPERKYYVSAYYDGIEMLGGDLWFYFDYSYQSSTWNNLSNIVNDNRNGLSPSSTYSSFSVGLNLPKDLSLELNVRNVFDETDYTYVDTGSNGDADLFGDPRYHDIRALTRPRSIWLTLRKSFGR